MYVLLVANGLVSDYDVLKEYIAKSDKVIAIDGGMRHLVAINHAPDLWVGDMDSFNCSLDDAPWLISVEVLRYPVHKDASDTELAVDIAVTQNATQVTMMGMLGNRVDHTLFNMALLKPLSDKGVAGCIVDAKQKIMYIEKDVTLEAVKGKTVSLVPITDLEGVSITGVRYPLNEHNVPRNSSLCLSNYCLEDTVMFSLSKGEGYIVISQGE